MRLGSNDHKIRREEADLANLLENLPENPIEWTAVLKLAAPILARLAVRMALKRLKRGLAEDKVNQISGSVMESITAILMRRLPKGG